MIVSLLKTYSRLFIFASGLLLGIQIPNFVDQYERRIDAHFQEVSANISGFQATADRLFSGDIEALIAYYRQSRDAVFESDAASISNILDRYERIRSERAALSGSALGAALHVVFSADEEFIAETFAQYGYTVPLDLRAIEWGLAIALLLTIGIDLGWFACVRCARLLSSRSRGSPLQRH